MQPVAKAGGSEGENGGGRAARSSIIQSIQSVDDKAADSEGESGGAHAGERMRSSHVPWAAAASSEFVAKRAASANSVTAACVERREGGVRDEL